MTASVAEHAVPVGKVSAEEAREIALDAYIYAYPLLISELTRRISVAGADGAAMNQFQHRRAFPDASFTLVVRPNADTLYSTLWYDVSAEPLVIDVPDSGGRYYLLPMLDLWSDVFASPGSRTTGIRAQRIVLAASGWKGPIPSEALLVRSPTAIGWVIGRTQTNGVLDYPNVHRFQDRLAATPLSRLGKPYNARKTFPDPSWDLRTPPVQRIEQMSAPEYFGLFVELMALNPPHTNDYPIVHRMARIGIVPGRPFTLADTPVEARRAIEAAAAAARPAIQAGLTGRGGAGVGGWRTRLSTIGTYGTDYRSRAAVAFGGLGANPIEDAIYPTTAVDSDGRLFSSAARYVLHFAKARTPPVRAFWSLTLYDERQLFAANPIHRYAIGDRDPLTYNRDGSLDLYIQHDSPGPSRESNWLPGPARGTFTLTLRLYWPQPEALEGGWTPPPVQKVA